ncbi:MAG: ABC transporter permease [Clostridia bacterium]|nr:ABC transporter permease [Clostridia bacterium]
MKFSTIWTVIRKEFARFFKDRRLVTALFLPGILIYVIYSLLGGVMTDMLEAPEDYQYTVCTVNAPEWFNETAFSDFGDFLFEAGAEENEQEYLDRLREETLDAYLVFPDGFTGEANGGVYEEVKLYTNSVSTTSTTAGQVLSSVLSVMQYGAPKFLVTPSDVATEQDFSGMMFSMIAPMLVLMLLFSGCISIAPESIAGEKERGSFATLLVTPVKRSHIAIGKIVALSAISLLSGVCSFIGVVLSLPKLMGGDALGLGSVSYAFTDYLLLLAVVLSSVLVMVALASIASALAKSVKEATGFIGPLTILMMLVGLVSSFLDGNAWYFYLIPLLNSATAMSGIFSFAAQPWFVLITVAVNLAVAFGLSWLLTKMFDSEKIMFSK